MFKRNLSDKIYHFLYLKSVPLLAKSRRKKLNNTDFTIISNNCWGGICYEHYGLTKNSPTVGTYMFADDYLKFASNLKNYINRPIKMITSDESKWSVEIKKNGSYGYPVGVIEDVEIIFLHYKDPKIAEEKWNRRIKRINYDNLIFKFSKMNGCSDEQLDEFDQLLLPGKKFMFTNKQLDSRCGVYYPGFDNDDQISNDTYFWNKYFDVDLFINTGEIRGKNV